MNVNSRIGITILATYILYGCKYKIGFTGTSLATSLKKIVIITQPKEWYWDSAHSHSTA